MRKFLSRWYKEFKKDREIRANELLSCGDSLEDDATPLERLRCLCTLLSSSDDEPQYRDKWGNPDMSGKEFY
ncbi:hypothetical protein [Shewanella colwelliana]|uniref:hypothetical protein n=1 Tax=Shewanella colwelliana TaxID=23 RepID=UPI003736D1BC